MAPTYTNRQEHKNPPPKDEHVKHLQCPSPKFNLNWLKQAEAALFGKRGVRGDLENLKNTGGGEHLAVLTKPHEWESLKSVIAKMKKVDPKGTHWIRENLSYGAENHKRLRKMGIYGPHELRAAIRQYLPLRGEKQKDDPIKSADRKLIGRKIPGFFPTPPSLVSQMIARAEVHPEHSILEPSAGKGDIMDAIANEVPDANLKGIEFSRDMEPSLKARGHDVEYGDFLDHRGQYDRILMNPPFEKNQDADHVRHAFNLLKPGGKLVAIVGAGSMTNSQRKAKDFQQWLEENEAEYEKLPDGSFKLPESFRSTGVSTYMVTISK